MVDSTAEYKRKLLDSIPKTLRSIEALEGPVSASLRDEVEKAFSTFIANEEIFKQYLEFINDALDREIVGREIESISRETINDAIGLSVTYGNCETFRLRMNTPPILKRKASASKYKIFCNQIYHEVVREMPSDFRRIPEACIIYVCHFDSNSPHKAPYYDNDNLAIKGILDAVVPNLCYDDAACYCDNLYLMQPDICCFTELILISKASIHEWMSYRRDLDFCKKMEPFSAEN